MLTVKVIDTLDQVIADVNWSSASASHNLMGPGGWEVIADNDDPSLFLLLESRAEPVWVLLIDHETGHVHGGPLREMSWRDDSLVLSGGNANWMANTTITLPDVGQTFYPGSPARSSRGYERTAQAGSRSIYELVDDQMNNTVLPYRNINNSLTAASLSNTGLVVALEAEPFEPLLDTVRRWGLRAGVIADFQWRGASATLELNLRLPTVRSFRLWEQDGLLLDWEYFESGDVLNYPWVGGSGEGVNRAVAPVAPTNGIPGKWGVTIERFVNASSVELADLPEAGQVEIEANRATQGISATARSVGSTLSFSADYQIGDVCSSVFHGVEFLQVIESVEIDWRRSGKTEKVVTGEPDLLMFNSSESLGRQAAVTITPAGLAVGSLSFASAYTDGDSSATLDLQIVWARGEANIFDQATRTIERQVDGGGWVPVSGPVATGLSDVSYGNVDVFVAVPAFMSTLEFRAVLAQSGETSVTSQVLTIEGSTEVAPTIAPSLVGADDLTVGATWTVTANATGNPVPTVSYEWSADGVPIVGATGSSYTILPADVGKNVSVLVTATNGVAPDAIGSVGPGSTIVADGSRVQPNGDRRVQPNGDVRVQP